MNRIKNTAKHEKLNELNFRSERSTNRNENQLHFVPL